MPRRGSKEAREIQKRGGQVVSEAFEGQFVPAAHETFGLFTGETASPLFLPNIPAFFGGDPVIPGSRQLSGDIGNVLFPGQEDELQKQLDERFVTALVPPAETQGQETGRAVLTGALSTGLGTGLGVGVGSAALRNPGIQTVIPDIAQEGPIALRPKLPPGRNVSGFELFNSIDDEFQAARAARQARGQPVEPPSPFGPKSIDDLIADEIPDEFAEIHARRNQVLQELNGPVDVNRQAQLIEELAELDFQGNDILDTATSRVYFRAGLEPPPPRQPLDMIPPPQSQNIWDNPIIQEMKRIDEQLQVPGLPASERVALQTKSRNLGKQFDVEQGIDIRPDDVFSVRKQPVEPPSPFMRELEQRLKSLDEGAGTTLGLEQEAADLAEEAARGAREAAREKAIADDLAKRTTLSSAGARPQPVPPPRPPRVEPSPTSKGLLQDAAERAFLEGDVETGTALRQELLRIETSVDTHLMDEAARRHLEEVLPPVTQAGTPEEVATNLQIVREQDPIVMRTPGSGAEVGTVRTKKGLEAMTVAPDPGRHRRQTLPGQFTISDPGPGMGTIGGEVAATPRSVNPQRKGALRVEGFFGRETGGRQLRENLDELAAASRAQVTRAEGELLPQGLLAAQTDVQAGRAVPFNVNPGNRPGFQGGFRRVEIPEGSRKALSDALIKLDAGEALTANELANLKRLGAKDTLNKLRFGSPSGTGQGILHTQQSEGFNRLIDILIEKLAAGQEPKLQTGGRVA
jgi:hypothetical protein